MFDVIEEENLFGERYVEAGGKYHAERSMYAGA